MQPSKLAIFDIDGTLTKTNEIDHLCFILTTQKFISTDFKTFEATTFTHFTDSCIIVELYERYLNRQPSLEEIKQFQDCYFGLLESYLKKEPHYFQAIEGATSILSTLHQKGWAIALATGCWKDSAYIKLKGGGIDIKDTPIGTASDAVTRQDVMNIALKRAEQYYHVDKFDHVVYIGDGLWDRHSCATLAMPFVGMDADNSNLGSGKLEAFHLLANYNDVERVEQLLTNAIAPMLN